MSFAPQSLVSLGAYYSQHGGINLGIVGNAVHDHGYHLGKDRLPAGDYSAKTNRDIVGLSNAASAIDLGKINGNLAELQRFSRWLVASARANDPDTNLIREIIYSPYGQTVLRWDRERGYASLPKLGEADDSHLTHTHVSFYRDTEFVDKISLFRGYFEVAITAQVTQRWVPTKNSAGGSNGVLRALPNRSAPIVKVIPLDQAIFTVAEVTGTDGSNMRLVQTTDRTVLYMLRSDWTAEEIITDPPIVVVNGKQVYP